MHISFSNLACLSLAGLAFAQSTGPSSGVSTTSLPVSLSLTTAPVTVTTVSHTGNRDITISTVFSSTFNVSITQTSSTATSVSSTQSASSTPTPQPIVLETRVDPAFGVLGAILILTGLPSAFWGHKNRWTSFFLIGFYTLSLVCAVLIIKFGVIPAVNPPSATIRGMFVLSSVIAGIAGGAIAIFFWKAARYGIGAWGGFATALWVQCFHNGGIIHPIALRWILYIGCGAVGFILCTIPKIHYHVLLMSTAIVGASAIILGVDCFTTAGLKEFYMWNLGFRPLFPKFVNNNIEFPVSQTMQIELGLIGAIALMGMAVQLRVLKVLQKKLQEIAEATRQRDEEAELQAASRFDHIQKERDEWEKEHPSLSKHGRQDSSLSYTPLMKGRDGSISPTAVDRASYSYGDEGRARNLSGVSEFQVAPTPEEELRRLSRFPQSPGALPTLDLGLGIQEDVPSSFIAKEDSLPKDVTVAELEEYKRKEELRVEIETLRKSIEVLKAETPVPSSSEPSRRPSLVSRRTLSIDATTALLPTSHARPPRATDPRARVHSMELSALSHEPLQSEPISRPTSVPLQENDWDAYIQERKLLQPPSGISAPIVTTSVNPTRILMPPAVQEALSKRKKRESALGFGRIATDSSEDVPLAQVAKDKRSVSGGNIPVSILPPRKAIAAPVPQLPATTRTRTFEELNERHREKMRDLQAPLTQAEKEHAELEAAKQRWERSKILEREAVTRRQAEKVAALDKRRRPDGGQDAERNRQVSQNDTRYHRHSRSLSADKMASLGMSSKRLSMLKVEDWQRYQQEMDMAPKTDHATSSKRDSRAMRTDGVPFPDAAKGSHSRRKSRDYLS